MEGEGYTESRNDDEGLDGDGDDHIQVCVDEGEAAGGRRRRGRRGAGQAIRGTTCWPVMPLQYISHLHCVPAPLPTYYRQEENRGWQ